MKRILNFLKKVVPWCIAVLIFVLLINKYQPHQLYEALKHANLPLFFVISVLYFAILYIVDCRTISHTLTRFGFPISWKELLPARAITYLIMLISYPASQGAFAYYLKRTHKIPIFEVLGVFFFIALLDLYLVTTLAFIGSFFQEGIIDGLNVSYVVKRFAIFAYGAAFLHLVFWRGWIAKIFKIERKFKTIEWIKSKKIFCVFKDAKTSDYFRIALMRVPIHAAIVIFMWMAVRVFHAEAPFINVLGSVPISYLVGTVPITPGGLGTTNYVIVELLSPHVTGEIINKGIATAQSIIFAMTILWMASNAFLKTMSGLVWMRRVSRDLFKPTDPEDEKEVASEATHLMGDI